MEVLGGALLKGRTRADHVYSEIRYAIIGLDLSLETLVQELVQEKVLDHQLGVSRTPIREVLRRLAQEGFVIRILFEERDSCVGHHCR